MEKRKLSAIPRMEATPEMVEMADRMPRIKHMVTAELVEDSKILLLNFFEVQVMKMSKWNANREGYADNTASIAIQRVSKEERKNDMAKRSCRRTTDENAIHNKAVKIRKMTDEQLVHYVEDRVEKARSEGFNCGKTQAPKHKTVDITGIIEEISSVKGIGATKLADIKAILEKHLEVRADA